MSLLHHGMGVYYFLYIVDWIGATPYTYRYHFLLSHVSHSNPCLALGFRAD
jgi:hypothetical protein